MISVEAAKKLIEENITQLSLKKLPLNKSLNYFLAQDIYAPINLPPFNQSAMDGYAFKYDDIGKELKVINIVAAGDNDDKEVASNEAVRIFTGAKVPDSCDTVVMQELTEVSNNLLIIKDEGLKKGGNIRFKANQIKQGELVLRKGHKLCAATIGFLASLGFTEVEVYRKPIVSIIATGSELVKPGEILKNGQIYESNTYMLQAAFNDLNISTSIHFVPDNLEKTISLIRNVIEVSDLLILSGGISVGDYDYVKASLQKNNVKEIFYKVNQKPGKPLFFGKKNKKIVFALPGNPAAALTCFYQYVLPSVNILIGNPNIHLESTLLPIFQDYKKKVGRAVFLKAISKNGAVKPLIGQGSDVLVSMAKANSLIYISEEKHLVEKGEIVTVYRLPKK